MKTNPKFLISRIALLYMPFALVSLLISSRANAQQRDLYFGFESTTGTKKFSVHSDLTNLAAKALIQQGRTYAVIFGSSLIKGKFSLGNFSSEKRDQQPVHSSSTELAFNISPIQLFSKQDRVIEPYLITAVETTKVKSSGMFTPPKIPAAQGAAAGAASAPSTCSCTCPNAVGLPGSPSAPTEPTPASYSGNYGTTRINVGVGLNVHLTKGSLFLNLFAEMKYGISAGTTYSTQALSYTYALSQVAYSTGISVGITKDRSHGRLRKNRFR